MQIGTDNAKFFLLAAALDQAEVVIECVSGGRIPVDATWNGKPTALCYAALNGNAELLSYLLLAGADVGICAGDTGIANVFGNELVGFRVHEIQH